MPKYIFQREFSSETNIIFDPKYIGNSNYSVPKALFILFFFVSIKNEVKMLTKIVILPFTR